MKPEDLMVGDWIRIVDDDTDQSFETRITGVSGLGNIYAPLPEGEHAYPFSVDCIEPIPITPEILEKNGFELGGILNNTYSVCDSNYTITIGKKGRGQCDIMNHLFHIGVTMECCGTVHELQHALRICGIDKEIVL